MHRPASSWQGGDGDRARLDRFQLRRNLRAEDRPAYAATRLAALREAGPTDGSGGVRGGRAGPTDGSGWRPLGPFAIPHGRTAGSGPGSRPRVAGQVVALAVDPGDPAHLLAGAGAGGVWESRDGGRSWRPRTDDQPSTAVGAVAFAPGDPAVAYAGTGQGERLAALGVGLLRSGDGGASWRLVAVPELLSAGFHDLLVDPGDAGRLLAATTAGLWASPDGGGTWERRLAGRSWAVSRGPDGELLHGGEHGLHRSSDGGRTWERPALPAAPGGFDRVAVARGAGGWVVYVFAAGDGVGHLWRRDHPDGPFDPVKPPADLHSQQAWHSWACAADPGDPDVVWLGAAGLHRGARGADGRWAWVDLAARPSGDSLPPDQHAVVFDPADPRALYVANDGGLFRSPDGGRSWRSLCTGLAIAEVEWLADRPDHDAWLLAGAGELGTLRYEGTEVWFRVAQPDLDPGDPGAGRPDPGVPGAGGVERGGGLPAVPVNAVERDPARAGTVYAATDAGVWCSRDGGAGWERFGHGLPNAPALALALHRPSGLLRVGLLGRGVWEVAVDGPGRRAAAPVLRPSRFDPASPRPGGWWWECPDIKVEMPPGSGDAVEPVVFEDDRGPEATGLPELGGRVRPGHPARVLVQVHHRGGELLRDARVRVLAAPACLRPPDLPAGILDGDPPAGSPWRPVGSWAPVGDLEPGRSAVAALDWEVPADLTRTVCLVAVAAANPVELMAANPVELVAADGCWGLKNLTVLGPDQDGVSPGRRTSAPGRAGAGRGWIVRLDLWGAAGRGPFALAGEDWALELAAGLVLSPGVGGRARDAGLVPGRVGERWRPELVSLVQEEPGLADRLDLGAAFPLPPGRAVWPEGSQLPPGQAVWLDGIELAPDRAEPMLLLLDEPTGPGAGAVLLLDAAGRVVGGHTLRAP